MLGGANTAGTLELSFEGLRNSRGLVRVCVTQDRRHFPDCQNDPNVRSLSRPAGSQGFRIENLPPGDYAVSVIHDENGNGRLDTFVGIPREGFGFSRNPRIGFGPPSFDSVRVRIAPGTGRLSIRIRYIV